MKHLTPLEHRVAWLLAALLVLGSAGRLWLRTHPGRGLPAPAGAATNAGPDRAR
jgi:hypothetical protein